MNPAARSQEFVARRGDHFITTDAQQIDRSFVHAFLSGESYWARHVPFEVVERSIDHSLNFGLFEQSGAQLGYGRAITDHATFAFLRDVFLVNSARGKGLGAWLVATMLEHPSLCGLRRVMLATRDAHGLYERFGFAPLGRPDRFLALEHSAKELYQP